LEEENNDEFDGRRGEEEKRIFVRNDVHARIAFSAPASPYIPVIPRAANG